MNDAWWEDVAKCAPWSIVEAMKITKKILTTSESSGPKK
jgi:hypothetical protein